MKPELPGVVMLGLALCATSSFTRSDVVSAQGITAAASGGGSAIEYERRSTLAFSAVSRADGSTVGRLVYSFRDFDLDFTVHLAVDCLVVDGNVARLSGLVTKISANEPLPPFMAVGGRGVIQVEDNGSAGSDAPDRYSDLHMFDATCADAPAPYIPMDGNVVVRGS